MSEPVPPASMTRRNVLIGAGLIATVGLAAGRVPRQAAPTISEKDFEALFPKQFAGWTYLSANGLVLPPQDQLSKALYERLLTRTYQSASGVQVMLLIAYSSVQEGRIQIHRPEVCYPASGYQIADIQTRTVAINDKVAIPTRLMIAQAPTRSETVSFWMRVGPTLPTRWWQQRLTMAAENVQGRIPDGILARMSTDGSDEQRTKVVLDGFTKDLIASLGPVARSLMIGAR